MAFDPGEAARRQQEQLRQQQEAQRQRDEIARRHQQELQRQLQVQRGQDQKRFQEQMDRSRRSRSSAKGPDAATAPARPVPTDQSPHAPARGWRGAVLLLLVLAIVAVGAAYLLIADNTLGSGVRATVTTGLNVREGPTTGSAVVGGLSLGDEVVVQCVEGSWARLDEPFDGHFASASFLDLDGDPPSC